MDRVRFTLLTVSMFSLTTTLLWADENPAAKQPLEVLEDCIQAAESGDFARYVDHLSPDEQTLQAGCILFMTSTASRSYELGASITDPEFFLLTKTMHDLVQQHKVPEGERNAEFETAQQLLAQLTGEPNGYYSNPGQPTRFHLPAQREVPKVIVGVIKDPRDFLIAALGEIARPTNVEGEGDSKPNSSVNVGEFIKSAKALKWTIYTRGDYAVAILNKPKPKTPVPSYPSQVANPQTHVEFKRIDGVWKITRLLPSSSVFPGNGLATNWLSRKAG